MFRQTLLTAVLTACSMVSASSSSGLPVSGAACFATTLYAHSPNELTASMASISSSFSICANATSTSSQATTTSSTYSSTVVASSTLSSSYPTPTLPSVGGYLDCYTDYIPRTLQGNFTNDSYMTVQECSSFCTGYTYFGLENGVECWCGNTIQAGGVVSVDDRCYVPCGGNSQVVCGGVWGLSLYKMATPLGCYADSNYQTLQGGSSFSDPSVTVDMCAQWCNDATYFGLEQGNKCICGYSIAGQPVHDGRCNIGCSGNSGELCGGNGGINIWAY